MHVRVRLPHGLDRAVKVGIRWREHRDDILCRRHSRAAMIPDKPGRRRSDSRRRAAAVRAEQQICRHLLGARECGNRISARVEDGELDLRGEPAIVPRGPQVQRGRPGPPVAAKLAGQRCYQGGVQHGLGLPGSRGRPR